MFGYKLIKETRYTELLVKENALESRVQNSGTFTYEGLVQLRKTILAELSNVDYRLKQIQSTFNKLMKV